MSHHGIVCFTGAREEALLQECSRIDAHQVSGSGAELVILSDIVVEIEV